MGPGFARPRAPEPFGGFSKKKLAAAFHPRVLFNRTTGYSRPHKGSHVRLEKSGKDGTIKLTVPLHSELKKGTLHRIIKDAGLTTAEVENLK